MTAVCALLERCAAKEKEEAAWAEWWTIVASAASYPIRHLLRRNGLDPDLAADVLQELYEHLQEDSCARLKAFEGTTEEELRAYLRQVALRFASRWVQKEQRDREHEAEAVRGAGPSVRDGPTEQQIEAARREVQSGMSNSDREKLRLVSGEEAEAAAAVPARTRRYWGHELLRRYGDRI